MRDHRKEKPTVRPLASHALPGTALPDASATTPGVEQPSATATAANERRRGDRRAPVSIVIPPVVVATSDPSLSRMLTYALQQMRLEYREFTTGSQALSELTAMAVGAQPPVVVLDVELAGMDGMAVLERIGVDRPDTFLILVLSSHADESVQVRSLLGGAVDHMPKPFNVRILMAKIQRWVAMSAHIAGGR